MNDCVEITSYGQLEARVPLNPKDMETADLGHVLARIKVVEDWIKEARQELRGRLEFGDECEEFYLEKVKGKREIRDVAVAWKLLRTAGVPEARLLGCVDMPVTRAEKAFVDVYMKANPGCGQAEAAVVFNHALAAAIVRGEETKRMERNL